MPVVYIIIIYVLNSVATLVETQRDFNRMTRKCIH